MSIFSIIVTAFSLSMDAFAVSITKGISLKKINLYIASKIALFFGIFQGVMPLIGWVFGTRFELYIKSIDHWVAFILLGLIGFKMILESKEDDSHEDYSSTLDNKELIVLSIATSIDALAVGVSFAFLNIDIVPISIAISVITFIVCFLGVLIGRKIGSFFKKFAQILGGCLLIFIGFNILNDHIHIITNLFRF